MTEQLQRPPYTSGVYTFATLPSASLFPPSGPNYTTTLTTDFGPVYSDGNSWLPFSRVPSVSWASRGSGSVLGERKWITDIGPVGGLEAAWDGTYWRAQAALDVVFDTALVTASASTAEQILKQATLPAGLFRLGRSFAIRVLIAKDGVTDAMTNFRIRLGTTGTVADTAIATGAQLNAAGRSCASDLWCFPTSAANIRYLGNSNGVASATTWNSGSMSQTYPKDFVIPDLDVNPLIISVSTQMAGTTNLGQVAHLLVEIRP